jgi:hypothetical protein
MAEYKATTDDAVKHISSTLSQYAPMIRRFQDTIPFLKPKVDACLANLCSSNQQQMRLLETNRTTQNTSEGNLWTQAFTDMRDLNNGLVEVKKLNSSHRTTGSS